MNEGTIFSVILLICVISVHSLTVRYDDSTNTTIQYDIDTPRIHFKNQKGFGTISGLQVVLPDDRYGCSFKDSEGALVDSILMIHEGSCPIQQKFEKAHKVGVKYLIIAGEENQEPGSLVFTGTFGIHFTDLIVVEMFKDDAKELESATKKYYVAVDLKDNDKNVWLNFYKSGGLIIWQIILSGIFLAILGYAVWKIIRFIQQGSSAPTVYISLGTVILSCVLCLLYTLVDPMGSRGVYNQTGLMALSTIYLPPTFISTFLVTFTLLVTFKAGLQDRSKTVSRVVLFYIILSVISFIITIVVAIIRGEYLTGDQAGSVITAILFIVFAITVIIGYAWAYKQISKEMGKTNMLSGNFRSTLRKFLTRNLWVFSVLYVAWLIVAIGTTLYFVSLKQSPTGHAFSYFFLYFIVALINVYHVLLFEIPKGVGSSSSGGGVMSIGSKNSARESSANIEL